MQSLFQVIFKVGLNSKILTKHHIYAIIFELKKAVYEQKRRTKITTFRLLYP